MKWTKHAPYLILAILLVWLVSKQHRAEQTLKRIETEREAEQSASVEKEREREEALKQNADLLAEATTKLQAAEDRQAQTSQRLKSLETHLQNAIAASRSSSPGLHPSFRSALQPELILPARAWGAEQAVGVPDTNEAGDIQTAWASREPDGGEEWLELGYDQPVEVAEIRVRETYNPGAISKIAAVLGGGEEVILWEGVEPEAQAPTEMAFTVSGNVRANQVRVYLDTKRVPGWNEIDAVELVGKDGSRQWAKNARSSSSYADR